MAIGEPKIGLTLSKGEESLSYAELMEQLHAMVKAKNGKPLSPDEIRIIKDKLESFDPGNQKEISGDWEDQVNVAREIMGEGNVYGPEQNVFCYGNEFDEYMQAEMKYGIDKIPFTADELKRAKEMDMCLVYKPGRIIVRKKNVEIPSLVHMVLRLLEMQKAMRFMDRSINAGNLLEIISSVKEKDFYIHLTSGWMMISNQIVKNTDLTEENQFQRAFRLKEFFSRLSVDERIGSNIDIDDTFKKHCPTIVELLYFIIVRGEEKVWKSGSDKGVFRAYGEEHGDQFGIGVAHKELVLFEEQLLSATDSFHQAGILFKWEK